MRLFGSIALFRRRKASTTEHKSDPIKLIDEALLVIGHSTSTTLQRTIKTQLRKERNRISVQLSQLYENGVVYCSPELAANLMAVAKKECISLCMIVSEYVRYEGWLNEKEKSWRQDLRMVFKKHGHPLAH